MVNGYQWHTLLFDTMRANTSILYFPIIYFIIIYIICKVVFLNMTFAIPIGILIEHRKKITEKMKEKRLTNELKSKLLNQY